jgi:hypothetical protein
VNVQLQHALHALLLLLRLTLTARPPTTRCLCRPSTCSQTLLCLPLSGLHAVPLQPAACTMKRLQLRLPR